MKILKKLYYLIEHFARKFYKKSPLWVKKLFVNNIFKSKYSYLKDEITENGYSIKHCIVTKSIFVHIPKAAGVSINKSLYGSLGGGHLRILDYQILLKRKIFKECYKFSFVRNPWDRVLSAYLFLLSGGFGDVDLSYHNTISTYTDFNSFVKNGLLKDQLWKTKHFLPQINYLKDNNNAIDIDFIGKFENIDEDYKFIMNKLEFATPLKKLNQNSINKNNSYKDIYDNESKDIVANIYREEIILFNYHF